jgi:benzoyl-CoA reductase/2-hydroxyglutaryl-CoA dehydratase subunit BcrC/BadD/HgdB
MKIDPVPMSGYEMSLVFGRVIDRKAYISHVKELLDELRDMISRGDLTDTKGAKRILLTGCPTGLGADKVLKMTEECGAVIVCRESCTGMKSVDMNVDESKPPLEAIAERYFKLPCSCMTPNKGRFELLDRMIEDFKVDGVIDLTWEACHTYNIESYLIAKHLKDKHNLPMLHVETDYSDSDTAQLRTRIEAFLDILE